jgi:diguanylate cyclase (GGDEF)-like protein/PAS domain S-box-containing protein
LQIFQSFRNRFIIVALVLAIAFLVMAIYVSKTVETESLQSRQVIIDYNLSRETLNKLNDAYLNLKTALYRYTLLLTPKLKVAAMESLHNLQELANSQIYLHMIDVSPAIKKYSQDHQAGLRKLEKQVTEILHMQDDARTRYPAAAIMLNELQPLNFHFTSQLDFAINEVTEINSQSNEQLLSVLEKLRYLWARHVSEVRLFVANRSGTFGDPDLVLPENIKSVTLYTDRIDRLLGDLQELQYDNKKLFMLQNNMQEMVATSKKYREVFKRTVDAFLSEDWQADVYYLEHTLDQQLKENLSYLHNIETELGLKLGQRVGSALETSNIVSVYIMWFVVIVYLILLLAYYAFEKTIREPLLNVAKGLKAQGKGQKYQMPSERYFAAESHMLIRAFQDMKEQVDSRQLRLQSILENAVEGIVITDEHGLIETFNTAAEKLFHISAYVVIGQSVGQLLSGMRRATDAEWMKLWTDHSQRSGKSSEVPYLLDDMERYLSIKTSTMELQGKNYFISVVSDITDHKLFTHKLQNLADMDTLTNLHNRRCFTEVLDRLVERANRIHEYNCALIFIDLDNFKTVNDTYGHHAGDRVLIEVSNLLLKYVRKSDLLARLGGDEFAVILYDIDEQTALDVANKYLAALNDVRFYEQGRMLDISCTIGLSLLDREVKNKDEFLNRADFACQMAKQMGRNRVYLFTSEDSISKEQLKGQMGIAHKIKEAVRENKFTLHYQPIKTASLEGFHCYEVLIRMQGDKNNLIMPYGFLPSAERFDLMKAIDIWVIKNTLEMMASNRGHQDMSSFAINLSAQSIGDFDMLSEIESAITHYQIPPEHLIFEITESNAISNMTNAIQFLLHLRKLGCRTALDDFGAGYSSYAYLKDLPTDYIKIDGVFVRDMDVNHFNYAMVKSINDIAHVMGKKTIAEFVENEEILYMLQEIGVDYVQGFYIGKPAELDTIKIDAQNYQ